MKQPRLNKKKAFTLVELLIVMVIIGILTVTVVVGVNWSTDRARESGVQSTLHSYELAANKVGVQLAGYDNSSLDELVKLLNKSLDSELKLSISDGVIVSDMATFQYIVDNFEDMEAHCSTQMGLDDLEGTLLFKEFR